MKRLVAAGVVALVLAGMAWGSAVASGQESAPPRRATRGAGMLGNMNLTDEQKVKAKEIMDAARIEANKAQDVETKMKIFRDAAEKVRTDVLTAEQRQQVDDLRGKLGFGGGAQFKLTDEQKAKAKAIMDAAKADAEKATDAAAKIKILKDAFDTIKAEVLTDEQRKQADEMQQKLAAGFEGLAGRLIGAKLTDEQKAKAKEIIDAAKADAEKAADLEAKINIAKEAFEKIKNEVLTADQRKALDDAQARFGMNFDTVAGWLRGLTTLSDDQKAKIKDIMQAAKADAEKAADGQTKGKIFKDAFEKIRADVLTDEQRKQLDDAKAKLEDIRAREQAKDREKAAE